jgi:hypothetical protein
MDAIGTKGWVLKDKLSTVEAELLFFGLIILPLAYSVSGFWIAFWQRKENSLNWIFGAVIGSVLINVLDVGKIEYSFLLIAVFLAWIGGAIGKRFRLKFLRNQSGNN